jgi:hypothetical protein
MYLGIGSLLIPFQRSLRQAQKSGQRHLQTIFRRQRFFHSECFPAAYTEAFNANIVTTLTLPDNGLAAQDQFIRELSAPGSAAFTPLRREQAKKFGIICRSRGASGIEAS